jgi:death-on-curing protein
VTRYLSLAELWFLSELVTGIDTETLIKASRVDLADSALHAPQAGFDDTDFYPDVYDKAAVLACRIAGIIRSPTATSEQRGLAWCCSSISMMDRGMTHNPTPTKLSTQCSMLAVAARDVDETWLAGWLRERVAFGS